MGVSKPSCKLSISGRGTQIKIFDVSFKTTEINVIINKTLFLLRGDLFMKPLKSDKQSEFLHIPVSNQGQITLPKAIRDRLGIKTGIHNRINIISRMDGSIVIEPEPTVDSLFGVLKPPVHVKPANSYDLREEMDNERIRELGYSPQTD